MTSDYIINRVPNMYGGQQSDYVRQKDQVIGEGIKLIKAEEADHLDTLFYVVLTLFATKRQDIALSHNTEKWHRFGMRRDDKLSYTLLTNQYQEYGDRIASLMDKIGVSVSRRDLRDLIPSSVYRALDRPGKHRNKKFSVLIPTMELDKTTYPLTRYLKAEGSNRVLLIHQETCYSNPFLEDLSKLFAQAVQWTGDINKLKQNMATFRFEFSHCMPFYRGSAAIAEWMETAIYRYHGFQNFNYNPGKMVDLEALTSSFEEFSSNYPSMIHGLDQYD